MGKYYLGVSMPQPNLLYMHICDDVRQETGGKISIMGVYDSYIVVPEFPYSLSKLCFYCRFNEVTNKHIFNFSIVNPSGEEAKIIEDSPCNPEKNENQGIFNVIAAPFEFLEEGKYQVIIKIIDLKGDEISYYTYTRSFFAVSLANVKKQEQVNNSQEL